MLLDGASGGGGESPLALGVALVGRRALFGKGPAAGSAKDMRDGMVKAPEAGQNSTSC